jgi:hypothetical protein
MDRELQNLLIRDERVGHGRSRRLPAQGDAGE